VTIILRESLADFQLLMLPIELVFLQILPEDIASVHRSIKRLWVSTWSEKRRDHRQDAMDLARVVSQFKNRRLKWAMW
jgi:hypothetical protein